MTICLNDEPYAKRYPYELEDAVSFDISALVVITIRNL